MADSARPRVALSAFYMFAHPLSTCCSRGQLAGGGAHQLVPAANDRGQVINGNALVPHMGEI